MITILATEIWGHTRHVDAMANEFKSFSDIVIVVDPYDGHDPEFASEDEAYSTFLDKCDHKEFGKRVSQLLMNMQEPAFLVGFSAGAGAVWSAVCQEEIGKALGAVCFYGSNIRNMTDLSPNVPTNLIFPEHEPHFDTSALVKNLEGKPDVRCELVPQGHGFMNPLSENYDEDAYNKWIEWIGRRAQLLSMMQD